MKPKKNNDGLQNHLKDFLGFYEAKEINEGLQNHLTVNIK